MTRPDGGRRPKPCGGCGGGKPIYTDGDDFFKWDPELQLYRVVSYKGDFHPISTHPGVTEQQLMTHFSSPDGMSSQLKLATEYDIMWRTFALVIDVLTVRGML